MGLTTMTSVPRMMTLQQAWALLQPKVPGARMRGGRDGLARGMCRRGRLWQQYARVVRRLSVRPSPAFGTLSPHAGRGEHLRGTGSSASAKTKTAPCGAVPCHVVRSTSSAPR